MLYDVRTSRQDAVGPCVTHRVTRFTNVTAVTRGLRFNVPCRYRPLHHVFNQKPHLDELLEWR